MSSVPANIFPSKTLERKLFGQLIVWFFYAKGPFLDDAKDADGFVPVSRLLSTRTMRDMQARHPTVDLKEKLLEVAKDAFAVCLIQEGEGLGLALRAYPWARTDIGLF
jgi:hypothetical protein